MEYELREASTDDPAVHEFVAALRDEVDARGAHANESAGELRRPIGEALQGDRDILVAYAGREPAGMAALRVLDPRIGEIKRMYVIESHRGAGVGRLLLRELERRARERGLEAVRLDTHDRLSEANGLYTAAGYREIPDYNGNPSANRWFEKSLA
jgi:GNAT superfamily N-acetyltransferase